jgi:hypothetical protein
MPGKSRKMKGGASSGWQYVYDQVGNGWTQFQNALTLQPGQNLASMQTNDIEPIGKPNFQNYQAEPTAKDLQLIQSAGRRKKKSKKGGNWGAVINQAAAPLALFTLQNTYKKKSSTRSRKSKKSRKSRKLRRR